MGEKIRASIYKRFKLGPLGVTISTGGISVSIPTTRKSQVVVNTKGEVRFNASHKNFRYQKNQEAFREEKMKSIVVEIRAGEGGDDAKDLVRKQATIYQKVCARRAL